MSDNFKVVGVGGAGVNVVRSLGYRNSIYIESAKFRSLEEIGELLKDEGRGENVVIVSSPAGEFSSEVLKFVCSVFNSKNDRIYMIGIMPFHSESPERKKRGDVLIRELRRAVQSTTIVENENFASSMKEYTWIQVMSRVNEYVGSLVRRYIIQEGREIRASASNTAVSSGPIGFPSKSTASLN